ncbi:MAG TPA: tetratricopeptide repeat protein [Myxococcota bacterium]|nr:tetratricopeptide repeat protein [Myxococcota bacterium]HRY94893.1 tetratricopeptide repeat protein [Myxococcota bacterium]HSA22664.1 tetratricopeptide repeat protein [Myxococcota bacterium]
MLLFAVLGLGALGAPAQAGPRPAAPSGAKQVDQAIQLYYEGRYQKAEQALLKALESPDLDAGRKLGALQYLAFCQVAMGDVESARQTFDRVLTLRPDFVLPAGTPPKISNLFEEVKATRTPPPPPEPPTIKHQAPPGGGEPRSVDVEARVARLPEGGQVVVAYRFNQRSDWSRLRMTPADGGRFTASLPAPASPADRRVEYFLEVLDRDGQRQAQAGGEDEPLQVAFATLPAPPPPKKDDDSGPSIHWWLWPVVGVVLLGAGLAIGLTVGGDSESTGLVRVQINPVGE